MNQQYPRHPPAAADCLPECRMEMLGLDPASVGRTDPDTFIDLLRECACCNARDLCVADLQRDPNDPIWENYCPNAAKLLVIARAQWTAA